MVKRGTPPDRCPFCGDWTDAVRHIMANAYEMACLSPECERTAVIMVDDFERLPSPQPVRDASNRQIAPPQSAPAPRPPGIWDGNGDAREPVT